MVNCSSSPRGWIWTPSCYFVHTNTNSSHFPHIQAGEKQVSVSQWGQKKVGLEVLQVGCKQENVKLSLTGRCKCPIQEVLITYLKKAKWEELTVKSCRCRTIAEMAKLVRRRTTTWRAKSESCPAQIQKCPKR